LLAGETEERETGGRRRVQGFRTRRGFSRLAHKKSKSTERLEEFRAEIQELQKGKGGIEVLGGKKPTKHPIVGDTGS